MLKIDAKLAELRAALETEVEASVRAEIANQISTLEATNSFLEAAKKGKGNETDRGDPSKDDDDDDEDDDEDDEDERKGKVKARNAKASLATASSPSALAQARADLYSARAEVQAAKAKKMSRRGESKDCPTGGDDEASAVLATLYQVTGQRGQGAIGALAAIVAKASQYDAVAQRVAALEASAVKAKLDTTVSAALQARRITPGEAKSLAGKDPGYVAAYLDARPQALVNVEETVFTPKSDLSAIAIPDLDHRHIEAVLAAVPESVRANLKTELETKARERVAKSNGGRY